MIDDIIFNDDRWPLPDEDSHIDYVIDYTILLGHCTEYLYRLANRGNRYGKYRVEHDLIDSEKYYWLYEEINYRDVRYQTFLNIARESGQLRSNTDTMDIDIPSAEFVLKDALTINENHVAALNNCASSKLLQLLFYDDEVELQRRLAMASEVQQLIARARAAKIKIQPMHAASRLEELGFDPIKALVNQYYELQLMLETMRCLKKRSHNAEASMLATQKSISDTLIKYGYLTANEVANFRAKLNVTPAAASTAVHVHLTSTNEEFINKLDTAVSNNEEFETGVGHDIIEEESSIPDFVPSPDIIEGMSGMDYRVQQAITYDGSASGDEPAEFKVEDSDEELTK